METHTELVVQTREIEAKISLVVKQAQDLVVRSRRDCDYAAEILHRAKAVLEEYDAVAGPVVKEYYRTYKDALAEKARVEAPLVEVRQIVRPKVAKFLEREEERRRKEEEKRRKVGEDLIAKEAASLREAGDNDAAQAIEESAPALTKVNVPAYKPEGVSQRVSWHFRITDIESVPREYLMPDEAKIGAVVRATKGTVKIPGVGIWSEKGIMVRSS